MWRHRVPGAKENSRQGSMEEALSGFGAVARASPGRTLSRTISHHKALLEQL